VAPVFIGAITDTPEISTSRNPGGVSADNQKPKHVAAIICDIVFSWRLIT
jgi:hypothetical protein